MLTSPTIAVLMCIRGNIAAHSYSPLPPVRRILIVTLATIYNCVNGECTEVCSKDSDCGANQVCYLDDSKIERRHCQRMLSPEFRADLLVQPQFRLRVAITGERRKIHHLHSRGETLGARTDGWNRNLRSILHPELGLHQQYVRCWNCLHRLCTSSDSNCECQPVFTSGGNFSGRTECTAPNTMTNSLTCQTGNCGAANCRPAILLRWHSFNCRALLDK